MDKIDFKKELAKLYRSSAKEATEVIVPPLHYLMIDGKGDPNTSTEYAAAVEALYRVSYTAKFAVKKSPAAINFSVMPLEGLWWADDLSVFVADNKAMWQWTMMIMQPDFVTQSVIEDAMAAVAKKTQLPSLNQLRFEIFHEGRCAQILHVGPFANEGPTIEKLHSFIDGYAARKTGKHHEIYLSDIRRAAPEKWKTILRQPMS